MPGPYIYENWRAASRGGQTLHSYEVPIFTDAHVVAELREGYGPYQFINPVAHLSGLRSRIIARVAIHYEDDPVGLLQSGQLDSTRYHGGGLDDELAAFCSLFLGARCQAGAVSRRFEPGGDPLGRPIGYGLHRAPTLPLTHGPLVVPYASAQKDLGLLTPLQLLPLLTEQEAVASTRVARMYQNGLWIAESDPELSWVILVSAVEAAADHWFSETEAPLDRLRAWGNGNDLIALLEQYVAPEVLDAAADLIAPRVGSRRKFSAFISHFLPPPPVERPLAAGQHSWEPAQILRSMKVIYDYRSDALHSGRPFPAPMCEAPKRVEGWQYPAEIPLGSASATLGAAWDHQRTPMLLHTFEYIARNALANWIASMAQSHQPKPESLHAI